MRAPTTTNTGQVCSSFRSTPEECPEQFSLNDFYYKEISELTEAGGWSINFKDKKSFFDEQARTILKVPDDYVPTLKSGYMFYAEEHREKATALFFKCAQGNSFSTRIKMVTYEGYCFWARAKGKPLTNAEGEIIGIRGVFQNIDHIKIREEQLTQSLQLIESHNARLYDFAHIISHNLRSQVSNLQMCSVLFDRGGLSQDQQELLENFEQIGTSLDTTLRHLNKIVSVHHTAAQQRETVAVQEVYNRVIDGLSQSIRQSKATLTADFSKAPEVMYLEVYFESIIQNLVTNAIKYKHPERYPEISIFTYKEKEKTYLVVTDNGLGIDLDKYGTEIFKLYKTFHGNKDALGLGLFLTKNEVEAMGGQITIESKVGLGSTFTVEIT